MGDIVIIGGVAAGMSAAAKLRRIDQSANITVFEKGDFISYGACGLPYFIADITKSYEAMLMRSVADFKKQRIDVCLRHEVLRVFPQDRNVFVRDLEHGRTKIVHYDKLLIATGASPIKPPFVKEHLANVFTLKTIPDGIAMKTFFQNPSIRDVTIIGAGYIGMELVEAMAELGKNIRVIELQPQILPPLDAEMAEIVAQSLRERGIAIQTNEKVVELIEKNSAVTHVVTDKATYATDAVIANIGVKPNTDFLKNSGIRLWENGAVLTNEYMETNIPDIYGAGDCATSHHLVLHRPVHIALGTIANKQGRLAGENMAGVRRAFPGVLGTSVAKILQWTVAKTGISEREAIKYGLAYKTVTVNTASHAGYYPDPRPIFIKLVYQPASRILLGAQMVGTGGVDKRIDVFAAAITNRMSTDDIGLLDLAYAPPYATVWDAVSVAANAAK
ncbi:MAG TPA: CoA-disulfide reductase [Bacilli bacterium]